MSHIFSKEETLELVRLAAEGVANTNDSLRRIEARITAVEERLARIKREHAELERKLEKMRDLRQRTAKMAFEMGIPEDEIEAAIEDGARAGEQGADDE